MIKMKKLIHFLVFSSLLVFIQADIPAYKIYLSDGTPSDFESLKKAAADADVIFFGELHNNPIAHWLQLKLTRFLFEKYGENLVLGAEMFEADDQLKLDEYLSGIISERNFEKEARLWPNYKTDYKPLVSFAKDNKLKFVATNVPRRYAAIVSKHGLDTLKYLSKEAHSYMAPLPVEFDPELPGYKKMNEMSGHGMKYLPQAQALKDATMAYFIKKNLNKKGVFLHYNGAYHSNNKEGIIWYLNKYKKGLKIMTISTVSQENIHALDKENLNLADFIIVVDNDMTSTY